MKSSICIKKYISKGMSFLEDSAQEIGAKLATICDLPEADIRALSDDDMDTLRVFICMSSELLKITLPDLRGMMGDYIMVGTVMDWASNITDAPVGWMFCDGGSYDPLVYPKLHKQLGEPADNKLPDSRGDVIFGCHPDGEHRTPPPLSSDPTPDVSIFANVGDHGGEESIILSAEHLPPHQHDYTDWFSKIHRENDHATGHYENDHGRRLGKTTHTSNRITEPSGGSTGEYSNLQPSYTVRRIIKVDNPYPIQYKF